MACPLCGEVCRCSDIQVAASEPPDLGAGCTTVFIDPDAPDASEQQFSRSLEGEAMDTAPEDAREWSLVGATAAAQPDRRLLPLMETSYPDPVPVWREEVSSRLESYRSRRRRTPRERSLSLDFGAQCSESGAPRSHQFAALNKPSPWTKPLPLDVYEPAENEVEAWAEPEPIREPDVPAPSDESNLIEFPRPPIVMPPSIEELAEPILDKPRILEAPEQVETSAPLADISLPAPEPAPVEPEVPLQVAPMSQRGVASVVDGALVLTGTAIFVLVASKASVQAPQGKFGVALTFALPMLLWAVYQYIFLVHGGATPGMKLARLRLVTFDGEIVRRRLRRWRALASVLSSISVGLGLLWALVDEDTLCWHDRITRTYVTPV